MTYLKLPTEVRPMPLEVSSEIFASELKSCFDNPKADATALLAMVDPFLHYWAKNLVERRPDLHMISLLSLLSSNPEEATGLIDSWVTGIQETHSLYEELQEIFLEELRNMKYWPAQAKPVMVEYVMALAFKRRLKDLIKCHKPAPEIIYNLEAQNIVDADWFLLRVIQENPWYQYLIESLARGYNIPTIAEITHISEDTIRNDMRELWQVLFSTDRQPSVRPEAKRASIRKLS